MRAATPIAPRDVQATLPEAKKFFLDSTSRLTQETPAQSLFRGTHRLRTGINRLHAVLRTLPSEPSAENIAELNDTLNEGIKARDILQHSRLKETDLVLTSKQEQELQEHLQAINFELSRAEFYTYKIHLRHLIGNPTPDTLAAFNPKLCETANRVLQTTLLAEKTSPKDLNTYIELAEILQKTIYFLQFKTDDLTLMSACFVDGAVPTYRADEYPKNPPALRAFDTNREWYLQKATQIHTGKRNWARLIGGAMLMFAGVLLTTLGIVIIGASIGAIPLLFLGSIAPAALGAVIMGAGLFCFAEGALMFDDGWGRPSNKMMQTAMTQLHKEVSEARHRSQSAASLFAKRSASSAAPPRASGAGSPPLTPHDTASGAGSPLPISGRSTIPAQIPSGSSDSIHSDTATAVPSANPILSRQRRPASGGIFAHVKLDDDDRYQPGQRTVSSMFPAPGSSKS